MSLNKQTTSYARPSYVLVACFLAVQTCGHPLLTDGLIGYQPQHSPVLYPRCYSFMQSCLRACG
ncbi:hypothetical protein PF005_g19758 [Phytophthora fragariae]|uniref:Uncharacterized protein n=1 Tax=Phytophthora fragariae TaxID=53985 RepID=A0A6A3ELW5_9STRA|nr:hypothetical protein PF003_g28059 [Phytophthora fragariae]KAE8934462.1 hypothetical protein PF009_g15562 [Phytophthora fragariae]KAE9102852.1 hypothetical protein PF007_g14604 [Phytophthora fragariae]KAE9103439.1 hypothetical protein PF010_g13732 [Phytophthora fragariae]KAE9140424.1 hypothetical protein PF006_g13539 [Phytophthora fragariae]